MASDGSPSPRACRCLNVRILPQQPLGTPPATPSSDNFELLYVAEQGITVAHIPATLRHRSRPQQVPNTEDAPCFTRYVSLTCLVCDSLVYRVLQHVDPELDHGEGPIIPTEDWAEQDALKSTTGWIEVERNCLSGEAIECIEASPSSSKLYKLVLPSGPPTTTFITPSVSTSPQTSREVSRRHLPNLPSIFPPPPFTPSHSAFTHLALIATAESEKLRDEGEQQLSRIAQEKAAEIQTAEAELKRNVELLWSKCKQGLDKIYNDGHNGRPLAGRRSSSAKGAVVTSPGAGSSATEGSSSVRISSFVPSDSIPTRTSSVASPRQVTSALSASLASSSFQHPRAWQGHAAFPRDSVRTSRSPSRSIASASSSSPGRSSITRVLSPSTTSTRTLAMGVTMNGDTVSIRDAHRRNMDQSKDIATSHKYVLDLEEQMERRRREIAEAERSASPGASTNVTRSPLTSNVPQGQSPRISKSSIKKDKERDKENTTPRKNDKHQEETKESHGSSPKGKRKVTFDVKPEVAIIETDATADVEVNGSGDVGDAVFDMEEEDAADFSEPVASPTLVNGNSEPNPTAENAPPRGSRSRIQDAYGLPSSLSRIRPASLPNMLTIRPPPRPSPRVERSTSETARDSTPVSATSESEAVAVNGNGTNADIDEHPDPQEAEILRLVAAGTPSHRHGWKKDSKSWQLFVNRQDRRSKELGPVTIEEEDEEDEFTSEYVGPRLGRFGDASDESADVPQRANGEPPIASSLPIPIMRDPALFGAHAYHPKTSLTERPGVLVPALPTTSSSLSVRKAIYALRDRNRAEDPGPLDYLVDLDDEEEDSPDPNVGSVGRERALKILKAAQQDELPAAGMWRSVA